MSEDEKVEMLESEKNVKRRRRKEPKPSREAAKKPEAKLFDAFGREVDKDGWLVDPIELKMQKVIKEVIEKLNKWHADEPETHHVMTKIAIYSIKDFNTADQTCFIDFGIQCFWKEPLVVGKSDGEYDPTEFEFKPAFNIHDAVELERLLEDGKDNHAVWQTVAPGFGSFQSNGILTWWNRWRGTVACPMDLKLFPFDVQTLRVRIESESYRMPWLVVKDFTTPDGMNVFYRNTKKILHEWNILDARVEEVVKFDEYEETNYSTLNICVTMQRRTGFYFTKIFLVLIILGLLMGASMFVTADILNDRFQIATTLLLSSVAFNFVVAESVPKVSYTTMLDKFFLGQYIFLFLSMVEHIVAWFVFEANGRAVSRTFDYIAIGVFEGVFILFSVIWISVGLYKQRQNIANSLAGLGVSASSVATAAMGGQLATPLSK